VAVNHTKVIPTLALSLAASVALAACGSSSSSSSASSSSGSASQTSAALPAKLGPSIGAAGAGPVLKTVGPTGEPATEATSVSISPSEIAQVQKGGYTARWRGTSLGRLSRR
jgi:hypothetical protein